MGNGGAGTTWGATSWFCVARSTQSTKTFGDEEDLESTHLATAVMTCVGEMCQTEEVKRVELKGLWDDLLSKCRRFKL